MSDERLHFTGRTEEANTHSRASGSPTISPRLLNLHQGAAYMGVSYWSLRDYVLAGLVPVIELPALRPREGERPRKTLRRVLVDIRDLDAFIETRKNGCAPDSQTAAPQIAARKTRLNRRAVPAV